MTPGQASMLEHHTMIRPCQGERVSGDIALVVERPGRTLVAIIDVLGHGPEAHEDALRARDFLAALDGEADPVACLNGLGGAMAVGRGAAAGVAIIETPSLVLSYAGVGNTSACVFGRTVRQLTSRAGILGATRTRPFLMREQLVAGEQLVMVTDGIRSAVMGSSFIIGRQETAGAIARRIIREYGKPHDDAGCVVVCVMPPWAAVAGIAASAGP